MMHMLMVINDENHVDIIIIYNIQLVMSTLSCSLILCLVLISFDLLLKLELKYDH